MMNANVPAVTVKLESTQVQAEQTTTMRGEYSGQFFKMGHAYYLRYVERDNEQPATVTFKIERGQVSLTRTTADMKLRLFFGDQQRIHATYRTPYGLIPIETTTPYLSVELNDAPKFGRISLDYDLYSQGQKQGSYKIRLQFQQ